MSDRSFPRNHTRHWPSSPRVERRRARLAHHSAFWLRRLWAAPISAVGLTLALWARASGGGVRRVDGVLEIHGGGPGRVLPHLAPGGMIEAITLGHVVWAITPESHDRLRSHEREHVRQCERWGPLFPLLYFSASALAWVRGRDPYRDNPFEQAAFAAERGVAAPRRRRRRD